MADGVRADSPTRSDSRSELEPEDGFVPVDVAGYVTTELDGKPADRYAALWVERPADDEARMYVGATADDAPIGPGSAQGGRS